MPQHAIWKNSTRRSLRDRNDGNLARIMIDEWSLRHFANAVTGA
jgi:hypothetical protein